MGKTGLGGLSKAYKYTDVSHLEKLPKWEQLIQKARLEKIQKGLLPTSDMTDDEIRYSEWLSQKAIPKAEVPKVDVVHPKVKTTTKAADKSIKSEQEIVNELKKERQVSGNLSGFGRLKKVGKYSAYAAGTVLVINGIKHIVDEFGEASPVVSLTGDSSSLTDSTGNPILDRIKARIKEEKDGITSTENLTYTPHQVDTSMLEGIRLGLSKMMENPNTATALKSQLELSERMSRNAQMASLDLFGRAFGLGNGQMAANAIAENNRLQDTYDKYTQGLDMLSGDKESRKQGALLLNNLIGGDTVEKYSQSMANIAKMIFDVNAHNASIKNRALEMTFGGKQQASRIRELRQAIRDAQQSVDKYTALGYQLTNPEDVRHKKELVSNIANWTAEFNRLTGIDPNAEL